MATITVDLDEDDIRAACMAWAVTRVLAHGRAVGCKLEVVVCNGKPTGTINRITVDVETDEMAKPLPSYVIPPPTPSAESASAARGETP